MPDRESGRVSWCTSPSLAVPNFAQPLRDCLPDLSELRSRLLPKPAACLEGSSQRSTTSSKLVPAVGIEPTLCHQNWILDPAHRPVPPRPRYRRVPLGGSPMARPCSSSAPRRRQMPIWRSALGRAASARAIWRCSPRRRRSSAILPAPMPTAGSRIGSASMPSPGC